MRGHRFQNSQLLKGKRYHRKLLTTTVKKIDPHLMTEFNLDQAGDRKKVEREMRHLIAHQECLLYQKRDEIFGILSKYKYLEKTTWKKKPLEILFSVIQSHSSKFKST